MAPAGSMDAKLPEDQNKSYTKTYSNQMKQFPHSSTESVESSTLAVANTGEEKKTLQPCIQQQVRAHLKLK